MNRSTFPGKSPVCQRLYYSGCFFVILLLLTTASSMQSMAQGNLLLTPQRVVFQGTRRIEELNLANTGNDTARYLISLINLRMKEDGSFEEISAPDTGQSFADKWVRFFPRSVTLGPQESQTVKIQLTRPLAMEPGEYRSHIYFRAIPDQQPLGGNTTSSDTSISVRLIPIFGVSIPVIIRIGATATETSLTDLSVDWTKDTVPLLNMAFRRKGNMSVYGDISVDLVSAQGHTTRIAQVKGVAVYTPNTLRRFRMQLRNTRGIDYHSGKLHVAYTTSSNAKPATIAEADLPLN